MLLVACRDAKDDKFLELAVNGNAELIVSGDEDLLILNPFQEIAIVTKNLGYKPRPFRTALC